MPYIYECIILLSAYVYMIVLFVLMERSPAGGQGVGGSAPNKRTDLPSRDKLTPTYSITLFLVIFPSSSAPSTSA